MEDKMPKRTRTRFRLLTVLVIAVALVGGALTIAYAQSGSSAFNLNSPASFPVDI